MVCGALTVGPASAAPQWLPAGTLAGPFPTPVTGTTHATSMQPGPQAAMDDNGDPFVAVRTWDGSHFHVQLIQRQRGGAMHTQTLGSPTVDVDSGSVQLAVAADGEAVVAWTQSGQVFAATGSPGQDLTTRGSLGTALLSGGPAMSVAAGDGGDRAVAFVPAAASPVQVARAGPGETIGPAVTVTGSAANVPFVAITPGGETVVGWTKFTTAANARNTLAALGKPVRHCKRVHGHRRCTTTAPRFAVAASRSFKQGADHLAFSGRVAAKALPRGTYTLQAVATDAARNRGKTVSTRFTIVSG